MLTCTHRVCTRKYAHDVHNLAIAWQHVLHMVAGMEWVMHTDPVILVFELSEARH